MSRFRALNKRKTKDYEIDGSCGAQLIHTVSSSILSSFYFIEFLTTLQNTMTKAEVLKIVFVFPL